MSLIDEIGELQFEGPAACEATLGKSRSDRANPARLPGWVNGLMDAEGVPVGVADTVLAPAREPMMSQGHEYSRWALWRLYKESLSGFSTQNC